ncbi:MAG: glycoside hydrolase family 127 protein [Bacteroidales bacterium]|nr:glycoside hydrolase family 127 protein [Bacteroidales bacterium]
MKNILRITTTSIFTVLSLSLTSVPASAQGLTETSQSPYAIMHDVPLGQVRWTDGFWGERFDVFSQTSVQSMWRTWQDSAVSHGFRNFEIAAGDCEGAHWGPPFHDGDMYKWLESVAAVYAVTRDPALDSIMDTFIDHVARAQRADGYIHTPVIIDERNRGVDTHARQISQTEIGTAVGGADEKGAFANRLNFETYNLGHLMMAGIVHKRATGKTTLYDCAVRATDFLVHFYETASAELARCAICPSHYMGVVEMWRESRNPRYLQLAQQLIAIRSQVQNGTDDNQDRVPFEEQYTAMGHAVRSTYLYAGVADIMAEIGNCNSEGHDWSGNLTSIWQDIVQRKMYITGGCGALYDGTSPDGTNYTPDSIQKVHQSFGRPYQLPNSTAHNETCANIGNMLFNWRMLEVTGDAKYADIAETCMLNSVLSGISLDGRRYFYTNPLRLSRDLPYTLRWPKERKEYISCFCCPPNTLRTLCEAQNYAYTTSDHTLTCQMYGSSEVTATVPGVGEVTVRQETDYPWDGHIRLTVVNIQRKARRTPWTLAFRLPEWSGMQASSATTEADGRTVQDSLGYRRITQIWKVGDTISIDLPMRTRLMQAHPLAEEIRNQVALQRGPVVYCLEECDLPTGVSLDDVSVPADAQFRTVPVTIAGSHMMALETEVTIHPSASWQGVLYREVSAESRRIKARFIPYYAWGNRGRCDMTVWLPLER